VFGHDHIRPQVNSMSLTGTFNRIDHPLAASILRQESSSLKHEKVKAWAWHPIWCRTSKNAAGRRLVNYFVFSTSLFTVPTISSSTSEAQGQGKP
jgi:hypothetical protein